MLKLIFTAVVLALLLIAGLAVGLYHLWGWKGLIAFPFLLLVILWLGKKLVFGAVRRFFMGLIGMKGAVLKNASVELHSVRPATKPEGWDESDDADEAEDANEAEEEPEAEKASEHARHYYEIDLTISPTQSNCFRLWEPSELELTSAPRKGLEELAEDSVSELCDCQIWDGNKFGNEDPGKYEGPQRVKIVFAVDTGIRTAHLNYYGNPLGPISLPEWTPPATEPPPTERATPGM